MTKDTFLYDFQVILSNVGHVGLKKKPSWLAVSGKSQNWMHNAGYCFHFTNVRRLSHVLIVVDINGSVGFTNIRKKETNEPSIDRESSKGSFVILGLIFISAILCLALVYLNFPNLDE